VRLAYFQRENRELVNLDSCEIIRSQFDLVQSYEAGVALDYFAEVADQMLPPGEPNERFFRLLRAVLDYLHSGGAVWAAVAYFGVWTVRLSGILPEMRISQESESIAMEILTMPVAELTAREWTKFTASDLRRFLVRQMEEHIERRLITASALEAL
jgi:DNA repair protein RecO (recombination protein O)